MFEIKKTTEVVGLNRNAAFIATRDALQVGEEFSFEDSRLVRNFYPLLAPKATGGKRFKIRCTAPKNYTVYRIA